MSSPKLKKRLTKKLSTSAVRKAPLLGTIICFGMEIIDLATGDSSPGQFVYNLASTGVALIPGWGTAVSALMDAVSICNVRVAAVRLPSRPFLCPLPR